jgi:2'-5' RNA ligase
MPSDPGEGPVSIPPDQRLNVFALVMYIRGPLGVFLDDLRRELAPRCNPHAHVSVLPPRSLSVDWKIASAQVRILTEDRAAFHVELAGIRIFPVTDVIYIELGAGAAQLRQMHAAMNAGPLEFPEPFPYHPHITLAQELPHDQVAGAQHLAERRWREFTGKRRFRADRATFVQNSLGNCWIDLAEYPLRKT